MDGFYIAPAFMDKLVVHITKNFMSLPNIKVGDSILFKNIKFVCIGSETDSLDDHLEF